MRQKFGFLAVLMIAMLALTACSMGGTKTEGPKESRLDVVKKRGKLLCGVNSTLPGFGFMASDGSYSGFDVDYCKAIAAAIFDDPAKVDYIPLNAQQRLTAVQTGEVDVLIRNTTWSLARDTGSVGMEFAPITFYDGQGMIVKKSSGITKLADFNNKSVCVQSGTTTELNLEDNMRRLGVNYRAITFAEAPQAVAAYEEGRCDGFTTDKSGLVSHQSQMANPSDHSILAETMSKEPLGPLVLQGDPVWFDVVKWVTFATIQAEEFGITSQNLSQMVGSDNPDIRRFLGVEGELGAGLGLTNDWVQRIIKHVGNYEEIFNRNLGPLNVQRGLNSLYNEGGLLYAPPFR